MRIGKPSQKNVMVWAEGGKGIGFGHLSRALSVAHELSRSGASVCFLVNDDQEAIRRVSQAGFTHAVYAMEAQLPAFSGSLIVIDSKKEIVPRVVTLLKKRGKRVVVIDNPGTHNADALICPSVNCDGSMRGPNVHAGAKYVIVGKEFEAARGRAPRPNFLSPFRVLVTMGGLDPNGLSARVARALKGIENVEVTVVVGPSATFDEEGFRVLRSLSQKDMCAEMSRAHLAFTAVGVSVYELACLGVPSILIGNYDGDEQDLKGFDALGFAKSLGIHHEVDDGRVVEAVSTLVNDGVKLYSMSEAGQRLIDCKGAQRVAKICMELFS